MPTNATAVIVKAKVPDIIKLPTIESKYTGSFLSIEIGNKFSVIFDNVFHVYLMKGLKKNAKKNSQCFFFNPLYLFWDAHGQVDKSENTFGISYKLSKHLTFYVSPLISH